jgi:uncharacterized protein (DUF1778 family)
MKNRRRELRIDAQDDDLITEAAGILGISVSEFMVNRAVVDAEVVVDSHHSIRLSPDSYQRFLQALDRPAQPPRELINQIKLSRPLTQAD